MQLSHHFSILSICDLTCIHSRIHMPCMPQFWAPVCPCRSWFVFNGLCSGMSIPMYSQSIVPPARISMLMVSSMLQFCQLAWIIHHVSCSHTSSSVCKGPSDFVLFAFFTSHGPRNGTEWTLPSIRTYPHLSISIRGSNMMPRDSTMRAFPCMHMPVLLLLFQSKPVYTAQGRPALPTSIHRSSVTHGYLLLRMLAFEKLRRITPTYHAA